MPAPPPGRIGQIALRSHDMDRSVAFWRDTVGLTFLFQAPNVAFFDVAGVRLMLGAAESRKRRPAGTTLYFEVADLDETFAAICANAARKSRKTASRISSPSSARRISGWRFLEDPDGNVFALMQERANG